MLTNSFFTISQWGHEVTLWILIILSVCSVAFIIERFLILKQSGASIFKILKSVKTNKSDSSFTQIQKACDDSEIASTFRNSLEHMNQYGDRGLEELFAAYQNANKKFLENKLNFLATVGSNAPFIGLLGTVFGIMDAFKALAVTQGEAASVMVGISQALVATAVGLMVAIPAVIAHNVFRKKVNQLLQGLEQAKNHCLSQIKTR